MLRQQHEYITPSTPGIRTLSPTRWTVKADSLQSVLDNYTVLQEIWQESLAVVKDTEMRARIPGISAQMSTFSFFFGVLLGQLLFSHSDNLSRTSSISAADGQIVASMTVTTLERIRNDVGFEMFWAKATRIANKLCIEEPRLPRRRKTPRRFEVGDAEPNFLPTAADHYKRIYFEALDLITCIKGRFDQPGYRIYTKLESLILKAAENSSYEEELAFVLHHYSTDFNSDSLKVQLQNLSDAQKHLLSEVVTLLNSLSPVDVCRRHEYWYHYITVDVYTRHSQQLMLRGQFMRVQAAALSCAVCNSCSYSSAIHVVTTVCNSSSEQLRPLLTRKVMFT